MKIPESVKIKTKTIEIKFDKELLRDDDRYGCYYSRKQKIFLDPTTTEKQQELAFFHELIHAIIDTSSLRVDLNRDMNEKVTTSLAEDLLLVIRENNLDLR